MGTTYGIHPNGSPDAEIVLDESSSYLRLCIDNEYGRLRSGSMTPEEVLHLAARAVQAALYWVEDADAAKAGFINSVSRM